MEKNVDISILCINNNDHIYNSWLYPSTKKQLNVNFEIVNHKTIYNGYNLYDDAYHAIIDGIRKCLGEYVLICHNDIRFIGGFFLERLYNFALCHEFDVIGFAGCIDEDGINVQYSSVYHKINGSLICTGNNDYNYKMVETVDECCFLIKKKALSHFKYLSKTWDCYSVQYCIDVIVNNTNPCIYVFNNPIEHKSNGKITKGYYRALLSLKKLYGTDKGVINTTCGRWYINKSRVGLKKDYLLKINYFEKNVLTKLLYYCLKLLRFI